MAQMRMLRPKRWVCFRAHTPGRLTLGEPGSPSTRPHLTRPPLSPRRVICALICVWLPVAHVEGGEGITGGQMVASSLKYCTLLTRDLGHWPSFATVSETFLYISKRWYFRLSFRTFRFKSTHCMNAECSENRASRRMNHSLPRWLCGRRFTSVKGGGRENFVLPCDYHS